MGRRPKRVMEIDQFIDETAEKQKRITNNNAKDNVEVSKETPQKRCNCKKSKKDISVVSSIRINFGFFKLNEGTTIVEQHTFEEALKRYPLLKRLFDEGKVFYE